MIVRSFLIGAFSAIFLLVGLLPAATSAQTPISLVVQQTLPSASQVKYPDVAVANRNVSVSGSASRNTAQAWLKTVDQTTFGEPTELGDANGFQDYINTAVSGRSDGTLTYAWLENDDNSPIIVKQRYANGTFSDNVTALGGGRFRVYVDVASNNAGTTVIVWSESKRFRYLYSTGGDITRWFGTGVVADFDSLNRPILAVGPNNLIGVAFGSAEGDIYYGQWNGSGFTVEKVADTGDYLADPTMTFLPNGTPVVAWRRVGPGYYYAKRAGVNNWPASQLSNDEIVSTAAIASDEAGNLAFGWSDITSGRTLSVKLAYATPADVFSGPVVVADRDFRPNLQMASTVTDRTQINMVSERFGGSGLVADYFLLTAVGAGTMGAQPQVTSAATLNGLPVVRGTNGVSVGFREVAGTPNQIRWRWGAPPTDGQNDSNNWVTFTNPISVPIDSSVNTSDCRAETLFTQVRNGTTLETSPKQISMIVDRKVSGSLRAVNPYIGNKLPVFTNTSEGEAWPFDLSSNGGASDGHPNYTREPLFYLEAVGGNDCVGLEQFRYGSSAGSLGRPYGIVDELFANVLPLPNPSNTGQGPRSLVVRLSDDIGNDIDYTTTITYDSIKPVLANGASFTITPDPRATAIVNLSFSSVNVSDSYPGGYWGAWVANSLTPLSNPLSEEDLIWSPAPMDPAGASPVLEDWSLLTGLNRTAKSFTGSQTFYVYVRFLDGAGNPTDRVISQQITLANVTGPTMYAPFIRR